MGAPATCSSGAVAFAISTAPPLIASGPTAGATPPITPTTLTRSGAAYAVARL